MINRIRNWFNSPVSTKFDYFYIVGGIMFILAGLIYIVWVIV